MPPKAKVVLKTTVIFVLVFQFLIADNSPVLSDSKKKTDFETHLTITPLWLQNYMTWHTSVRTKLEDDMINSTKDIHFLAVICIEGLPCGGLADRLRKMPNWLLLANQTKRFLIVHWKKSNVHLQDYFTPPPHGLDWTIPPNQSLTINSLLLGGKSCLNDHKLVQRGSITKLLGDDNKQLVCVDDLSPTLGITKNNELYQHAFRSMFQPSHKLVRFIRGEFRRWNFDMELDENKLVPTSSYLAAHIRSSYPMKSGRTRWRLDVHEHPFIIAYLAEYAVDAVLKEYIKRNNLTSSERVVDVPPVFVSSDNAIVVQYLMHHSSRYCDLSNNTVDLGGKNIVKKPLVFALDSTTSRTHINYSPDTDFSNVFFDFWMLCNSACIAHGAGGFGKLASSIGVLTSSCNVNYLPGGDYKLDVVAQSAKSYWIRHNLQPPHSLLGG
ncbi:hypothetical protein ACHAWF_011761 [Thalassiosira exigua]